MIVANNGSLVGSIGVILDYPVVIELLDKIGLQVETVKSGALKDSGSPTRPVSVEDRKYFQSVVDDQHEQFIKAVAEGRNLPVEEVRNYADGRIFTGNQALAMSLIDTIGTFEDAIAIAGQVGGIKGKPKKVELRKKRKSIFDLLYNEYQQTVGSRAFLELNRLIVGNRSRK
ncbi:S49 family peptidase [Candidatus Neomarinimicrobiota bacterium]